VYVNQENPNRMTFSFPCPRCVVTVTRECDEQVGRLLLMSGAHATRSTVAGLDAFRPDHITQLRALLDEPDWFDRLKRAG
jgi:hypothetical protein